MESVSPVAAGQGDAPVAIQPTPVVPITAILWFLGLLIVLFLPVLTPMLHIWATDENMGYAFFVPLVAGYIAWIDRDQILAAPVKPCWPALALIVWAFLQMLLGLLGALFFLQQTAFVVAVMGVIWTIGGTAVMRKALFPTLLLLFMVQIPLFIYQQMTLPLQSLATEVATRGLELLSIPVLRQGNVLQLSDRSLEVVEACSGIRSLLSLAFLSLAYGRLFETRKWVRYTLIVSTVPIAIVCNAARVTLAGILTQYKPEIAEGAYHAFEGWVIFMFELVVLLSFHRFLARFGKRSHA